MRARNVHGRFSGKNPVFPKWALILYDSRAYSPKNGPSVKPLKKLKTAPRIFQIFGMMIGKDIWNKVTEPDFEIKIGLARNPG